ncbi:MAG: glycosyltransferase family 39 protein [Vulcanimicrobiaceae bacterium]
MTLRGFQTLLPRWLTYLIVIAVVGGIFFRFYNLDRKVYWDDEICTSLRALGSTETEWIERSHQVANVADLRLLLHPGASQPDRGVSATVSGLANEDPQHSPLYYAAAHYWDRAFGDSTAALRSLSAVIGVLALPAAYWLCIELFESAAAAWIGVALFALSPVLVLYSQEAREYSLWSLVIFLMGASFLRAARLGSLGAWALYAAVFIFGLYVYPPCAFLAFGQAVYLAVLERGRPRALVYPALAMLLGIFCFSPWLIVMAKGSGQIQRAWHTVIATKYPQSEILRQLAANLRTNFLDFNLLKSARMNALIALPVFALVVYAIYYLCRRTAPRVHRNPQQLPKRPDAVVPKLCQENLTGVPGDFLQSACAILDGSGLASDEGVGASILAGSARKQSADVPLFRDAHTR